MISKKYRAIFIHIPKTGGTSIERKLELFSELERGVQDHRTVRDLEPFKWPPSLNHSFFDITNPRQFIKGMFRIMGKSTDPISFSEYFKFAFVRNTWDRTYSIYHNIMRDEIHRKRLHIKAEISFHEFIQKYHRTPWLASQLEYIRNEKGDIGVDFIGRFENLQHDFQIVCEKIGMEDPGLPHLLFTPHPYYQEVYDIETIDLVYKLYKKEITQFNFQYGETPISRPLN